MRILAITLLLASMLVVKAKKKSKELEHKIAFSSEEIDNYEKEIPGLKKDVELFGKCKRTVLKTSELRVKAALACKHQTDYTCYWACLMRERGFSGPNGLKYYKKYYKHRFTMPRKHDYVNTLAACVQTADLETMECNDKTRKINSIALNCMISVHVNYCSTGRSKSYYISEKLDMEPSEDADNDHNNRRKRQHLANSGVLMDPDPE